MREHLLTYELFSEEEVSRIVSFFKPQFFKKKELLVEAGTLSQQVFFIQKGCVRSHLMDPDGKEYTILFGTEGYWMGDLQSFTNRTLANYTYQAIEETEVYAITKSDWDQLMATEPSFVKYVGILFRNALIEQQNRIVELFTLSAEERYDKLIQHRTEVLHRVPQKYIASYIGITPEFLSQIRKKRAQS